MTQRPRLGLAHLAIALTLGVAILVTPGAAAHIDHGLAAASVTEMIPSTVDVPAGETTTVDIGVPVQASYSGDGWSVSSAGTAVTVTAPNQPGSQINVPFSVAGFSATITLVAQGSPAGQGEGGAGQAPQAGTPAAPGQAGQAGQPDQPEQTGQERPPRKTAGPVDTNQAELLYFDGEIHGNELIVSVSLTEAADLAGLVTGNSENMKVRYLDINGQFIENVQRDIDMAARTMTLTYPEGQTPDNPFIIEIVRDDAVAEYIVTITATNAPVATPSAGDGTGGNVYAEVAEGADEASAVDEEHGSSWVVWAVLAGAILLVAVIVAIIVAVRKATKRRR